MATHIKGDPNHPFVQRLKALVESEEGIEFRARFGKALSKGRISGASDNRVPIEPWRIIASRNTPTPIPSKVAMEGFASGQLCPTAPEIKKIALHYGMPQDKVEEFCEAGRAYIDHCQNLHTQQSAAGSYAQKVGKKPLSHKGHSTFSWIRHQGSGSNKYRAKYTKTDSHAYFGTNTRRALWKSRPTIWASHEPPNRHQCRSNRLGLSRRN